MFHINSGKVQNLLENRTIVWGPLIINVKAYKLTINFTKFYPSDE